MAITGKPPKFKSVTELKKKIDAYFKDRDEEKKPYTVCALALYLGFQTRQSIYDYAQGRIKSDAEQEKIENTYAYTVKSALLKIENYAEEHLYSIWLL